MNLLSAGIILFIAPPTSASIPGIKESLKSHGVNDYGIASRFPQLHIQQNPAS